MEAMKLMLVDDEERFLATTKKLLERKGYDVVTARSGAEALEILRQNMVHVVILDVKMPGMDGNATLVEIKRQFPMTEVIMLTGHATVESAIDGLKSGASDYLMKPTDVKDLIAKAEEAFSRRQGMEEKIRVARMRYLMKSPREIIANSWERRLVVDLSGSIARVIREQGLFFAIERILKPYRLTGLIAE